MAPCAISRRGFRGSTETGARNVCVLLAAAALLTFSGIVSADGKAFSAAHYASLVPTTQDEQRAAIAHVDGVQRMIIAVSLGLEDQDKALWIFPIPGTPDGVALDFVDTFPTFAGIDPQERAAATVGGLATGFGLYPIFGPVGILTALGGTASSRMGVTVHEEVEKWGLRAESVTAGSAAALAAHLADKGAALPEEELSAFEPYLSGDYVLVLVWIASREELRQEFPDYAAGASRTARWPCVYVEFPTDRAFYPLRPTGTYGEARIPVSLFVIGYVKPDPKPDFPLSLEHLRQMDWRPPRLSAWTGDSDDILAPAPPPRFTRGLGKGPIRYTAVEIDVPARELTEDLWFSPGAPLATRYAEAIESFPAVVGIVLVVSGCFALACLSAGLSGRVLYGKWGRYAALGLWCMLTIIVFVVVVARAKGDDGKRLPRRAEFVALFLATYWVLVMVLWLLLRAPLGWI